MMQLQPNYRNVLAAFLALFFLYLFYILFGPNSDINTIPMDLSVDLKELINYCVLAVESGGVAVRKIHKEKLQAKVKGKTNEGAKEFVTKADLVSNAIIMELLMKFPGITTVSEEKEKMKLADIEPYKTAKYDLWLASKDVLADIPSERVALHDAVVWVDPLDATQEYTEDLLQYVTVMICVAVHGRPKFGIIYRPFSKQIVWGLVGHRVYTSFGDIPKANGNKTIVVSRSHAGKVGELAKSAFGDEYTVEPAGGSGYKSLRVLNGTAEMYLHLTAIKKWDICAADAIIRAGGGQMTTLKGSSITYFSTDEVKNNDGLLVALNKNKPMHLLEKVQGALDKQGDDKDKS